ncbi:uncharacterized protein EV422DRAFT_508174 [Fimicolochytrium jonesii]|uniref:uncharacterized protein n=1 Tax=Fimicolochytrium jonesii TaxID=1396493 RepID=UPI0022FDC309|nr:uncharacterized protein EV422DRAFT_508174 [Fimicolochytrium jonesii]KAI8818298.1 hypothetical protein EV422DRAFT_508174 [Fimicolochytrium jonesii]
MAAQNPNPEEAPTAPDTKTGEESDVDPTAAPIVEATPVECEAVILTPAERKALIDDARSHKAKGNKHFQGGEYAAAIERYEEALALAPEDETEERGIFFANIAACHIHLKDYPEAARNCTNGKVPILNFDDQTISPHLNPTPFVFRATALKCKPDYLKALTRRALANSHIGSWASLSDALKDYKRILELDPHNREAARSVKLLPGQIEVQQEKEKTEMLGKLKDLGNTFLGNFGLSLDSFQMNKDEKGGFSVNMKK